MSEINNVNIPSFDEFAVKKIFPKIQNNKVIMKYLHELGQGQLVDRAYFYDDLSTLYLNYVADIINGAYVKRSGDANIKDEEIIQITPYLLDCIEASMLVSSNNFFFITAIEHKGKTIHLLKQTSKLEYKRKRRKYYEIEQDPPSLLPIEESESQEMNVVNTTDMK